MESLSYFETPTQVKFVDDDRDISYGIAIENYIICGCCGAIFTIGEDCTILRKLKWIDISQEIKGE